MAIAAATGYIGEVIKSLGTAGVYKVSTSPLIFNTGPSVTLTPGIWSVMGSATAINTILTDATFYLTDSGGTVTYIPSLVVLETVVRRQNITQGIINISVTTTLYLGITTSAGGNIIIGNGSSMMCGSIVAERLE